jgi:hypothetical protein
LKSHFDAEAQRCRGTQREMQKVETQNLASLRPSAPPLPLWINRPLRQATPSTPAQ